MKVGTVIVALELVNNVIFWCLLCFVTSPQLLTEQVYKIEGCSWQKDVRWLSNEQKLTCWTCEYNIDSQAENMRVKLPGMKTVFTFKISAASTNTGKPANDEIVQVWISSHVISDFVSIIWIEYPYPHLIFCVYFFLPKIYLSVLGVLFDQSRPCTLFNVLKLSLCCVL